MHDLLRERIRQAAEIAQQQSKTRIYDSIRLTWQGRRMQDAVAKRRLGPVELARLLELQPCDLSIQQLISLSDHIEVAGLTAEQATFIASAARCRSSFPLPPVGDSAEAKADGKRAAMRFAMWAGYVAAPALAMTENFEVAVELVEYLAERLAEADYDGVDGAGHSPEQEMCYLLLAPALAGLTQYCPASLGGCSSEAHKSLSRYFKAMSCRGPLTECVRLRMACLGIVAMHAAALPLLDEARTIATGRYERDLAQAFEVFQSHPDVLKTRMSGELAAV
jgi:hypothetical protein